MTLGRAFGWTLFLSSLFWPRVTIIAFWIFGNLLGQAFDGWIIPTIGFFVLPWTTMTYTLIWSVESTAILGWQWILVAFALLLDVVTWAGGGAT